MPCLRVSNKKSEYYFTLFFLFIIISFDKYHITMEPAKLPMIARMIDQENVLATPKVIILAIQC